MSPVIYYCYDAYCGWCYGFSPVIKRIAGEFRGRVPVEVLSGGMIPAENPKPIRVMAGYISKAYQQVEELTGIRFGPDYLWHIFHPEESDWYPHSEKSAIALCIIKEYCPDLQAEFSADLQYAHHFEGRDLTDHESYRHLLEKYQVDSNEFYTKLGSEAYREKARYEFALCQQLQVTGFPALLLQTGELRFYRVASGYTPYETVRQRIDHILTGELNEKNPQS